MNNKVKLAVLDTGIDKKHSYLKDSIHSGISFLYQEGKCLQNNNFDDDNGHGTACASAIKKECNNVDLVAVKILNNKIHTNLGVLEEALKYLLETDIRLINLSLSVINSNMVNNLYKLCNAYKKKDKIIICSLANGFEKSYPAFFDSVIGVKGFILEDEHSFWYNKNKKVQCIIDNNPYFYCDINNSYQMYGKCNSIAAAKLSGIVAKIITENPDIKLNEINIKLESIAKRKKWTKKDFKQSKRYPDFKKDLYDKNDYILKHVVTVVKEFLDKNVNNDCIYNHSLMDPHNGLIYANCFKLIKKLEDVFHINFDYMSISRYDFYSIYTLTYLVKKNLLKGNNYYENFRNH